MTIHQEIERIKRRKKNSYITSNCTSTREDRHSFLNLLKLRSLSLLTAGGRLFHRIAHWKKNEDARAEVRLLGIIRLKSRADQTTAVHQTNIQACHCQSNDTSHSISSGCNTCLSINRESYLKSSLDGRWRLGKHITSLRLVSTGVKCENVQSCFSVKNTPLQSLATWSCHVHWKFFRIINDFVHTILSLLILRFHC
jgi:hypothetical protein